MKVIIQKDHSPEDRSTPLLAECHEPDASTIREHNGFGADVIETVEELPSQLKKSSVTDSVSNLCNSTLGAGLYALPRVFAGLGILGGTFSIVLAGFITYFSVHIMLRASERHKKATYASTMQVVWGKYAAIGVHITVIACCAGFIVLYLVITSDVIVGNGEFTGILNDLFPKLPDPLPWYLSRTALITWVTLASAPLLAANTLHGMSQISALSVVCSVLSMLSLFSLAIIAACRGKLASVRLFPDAAFFGDNITAIITGILATCPVVLTAFSSQMSIHPILQDLCEYTPYKMRRVVSSSFSICSLVYILAGASGYAIFGDSVQGDVLASIQPETIAPFLEKTGDDIDSKQAALVFVTATKLFVAIAMLTSLPINLWPMRADILELLQHWVGEGRGEGGHRRSQDNSSSNHVPTPPSMTAFYLVTYGCLLVIYIVAITVTNMYKVVDFIGSTCCIFLAFVFPGLLALRYNFMKSPIDDGERIYDNNRSSSNIDTEPLLVHLNQHQEEDLCPSEEVGCCTSLRWQVFGIFLLTMAGILMLAGIVSSLS